MVKRVVAKVERVISQAMMVIEEVTWTALRSTSTWDAKHVIHKALELCG